MALRPNLFVTVYTNTLYIDIYLAAARANTEMRVALESADYPSTKESKSKVALGVG